MLSLDDTDTTQDGDTPVKSCQEALAAHSARLAELRNLVSRIAADIGLEAGGLLEAEVQALDKRLEGVRGALDSINAAAGEKLQKREQMQEELQRTNAFLESVHQSLEAVQNGGEEALTTLRDLLVALGKTENMVASVKERCLEIEGKPDAESESSIEEILLLWQQVFRETFQQYHRLSARLVRSEDSSSALRLWQEYLLHVQTFLSGALPADFDGLCETQRVCEVHQNLLTSQHAVLLRRKDRPQDLTQAVHEQCNSLANLHNETLTRIMDRHDEVGRRLTAWSNYRQVHTRLLNWLRDMTADKERLQLRYLHLRRVPRLLEQIHGMVEKLPTGKSQAQELMTQQDLIVAHCEDHLATSIRMDTVTITDRIQNLEAGLKSWEDFLLRVIELQKTFESQANSVESVCDMVCDELQSANNASFTEAPIRLERCQDLKVKISGLTSKLDELSVILDQLKECVSVQDGKALMQRQWLLTQRQAEMEHQLLILMHRLEERAEMGHVFQTRALRFTTWGQDVLQRFEDGLKGSGVECIIDPETRAKRLECETKAEVNLKSRDLSWLQTTAQTIIQSTPRNNNEAANVQKRLDEVNALWERLNSLGTVRAEKRARLLKTKDDLSKRLEELRVWLLGIETSLETPLILEKASKSAVDKLLKDHDSLHSKIESQGVNIGEVLNLCELLLQDPMLDTNGVEIGEFSASVQCVERRWKTVCASTSERRARIVGAWELLQQLAKMCKDHGAWLAERDASLKELKSRLSSPQLGDVAEITAKLNAEIAELKARAPAKTILDASYSKLAQESQFTPESLAQVADAGKSVINRWQDVVNEAKTLQSKLEKVTNLRDEFMKSHSKSLCVLDTIIEQLTQLELSGDIHPNRVETLNNRFEADCSVLAIADKLGLELMSTCTHPADIQATQGMIDEYQTLWRELRARITSLRERSCVESREVQVSTLHRSDTGAQVDTLPHSHRLTSRGAYALELDVALNECMGHLRNLERLLDQPETQTDSSILPATHHTVAKMVSTATSSVELAQHLSETVIECGLTPEDARKEIVDDVVARLQAVLTRARDREQQLRDASERGRLTCPLCTHRNWQQLDNDMWRLEKWVEYASATLRSRTSAPSRMEDLEDAIQDLRELLLDLDSHKSIVASLNIVGEHLADHATDGGKAKELRDRLRELNTLWDQVCADASRWQDSLQRALMENTEFHEAIEELVNWIGTTESLIRHSEPVDLSQDSAIIQAHYDKFRELSAELDRCEPRVVSLKEAAVQLLDIGGSARERLTALQLRLTCLKRLVRVYLLRLGAALGRDPSELATHPPPMSSGESAAASDLPLHPTSGDMDTTVLRRSGRFIFRVLRASLPIQALMLLLLGAATLVRDEDYSCALSNSARFHPYYPHQPPPV